MKTCRRVGKLKARDGFEGGQLEGPKIGSLLDIWVGVCVVEGDDDLRTHPES